MEFAAPASEAMLIGLFQVSILHNIGALALRDRGAGVSPHCRGRRVLSRLWGHRLPAAVDLWPGDRHGQCGQFRTTQRCRQLATPRPRSRDDPARADPPAPHPSRRHNAKRRPFFLPLNPKRVKRRAGVSQPVRSRATAPGAAARCTTCSSSVPEPARAPHRLDKRHRGSAHRHRRLCQTAQPVPRRVRRGTRSEILSLDAV